MKESVYKSYDELPLFLNSELVAKVLGVSLSSGYEPVSYTHLDVYKRQEPMTQGLCLNAVWIWTSGGSLIWQRPQRTASPL